MKVDDLVEHIIHAMPVEYYFLFLSPLRDSLESNAPSCYKVFSIQLAHADFTIKLLYR